MKYQLPPEAGSIETILERFDESKRRKDHWVDLLQEAFDYAIPHRETFYTHAKGQKRKQHLYDSTAIEAVKEFVSRVQATVIPPWREWTKLRPGTLLDEDAQDDIDIRDNLDNITKKFFVFLNHSNFALQSAEALMDYAVSTGCLMFDEGETNERPFEFKAIPLAEVYLEEGPSTLIETVFRLHNPLCRNLEHMYPNADLGEQLKKKAKEEPSARCEVVEGVVHVPNMEEFPYVCVAIEKKTKRLLWCTKYRTSPWIIFRAPTVPGELFGRGPVIDVLEDIKSANKMVEFILKRAAFSAAGVWTAAADGILNPYTMKIAPGTVIPVASNGTGDRTLDALPMGGEPNFATLTLEDLRRNIKRALFNNMRTADGPVKTATEIAIDNRELLEHSGATFGRLQTEFVERIVKRGMDIMANKGLIEPIKIDGIEYTLQHTSPLARAQDFEEIEGIQMFLQIMGSLGPEVMDMNVELMELGRTLGAKLGIDADLIKSKKVQVQRTQAQEDASAAMITAAQQGAVNAA